jgi:phosphonopyruvate decarboxylase
MLSCGVFYQKLKECGVDYFTGVPDSLLKDFCAYIYDHAPDNRHVIAANEGNAVALAAGFYLSAGKPGLVYMQNSGLGNAVNPLTSLVDPDVYGIPLLLLIGWRGEPGIKDEPQHVKQGKITLSMLDTLEISYEILPPEEKDLAGVLNKAMQHMEESRKPFALVVRKNTFESYSSATVRPDPFVLSREDALKCVIDNIDPDAIVVSTTGKLSRELFEYREERSEGHEKDFLTVGSMGHASQIAMAVAMNRTERSVFCLDGDGAVIMHLGALSLIGSRKPENFRHIVFNNGSHESVGGQPTAALDINLSRIAESCGYGWVGDAQTRAQIIRSIKEIKNLKGPVFLEIKVARGARKDLGRPTVSPSANKSDFMKFVGV